MHWNVCTLSDLEVTQQKLGLVYAVCGARLTEPVIQFSRKSTRTVAIQNKVHVGHYCIVSHKKVNGWQDSHLACQGGGSHQSSGRI